MNDSRPSEEILDAWLTLTRNEGDRAVDGRADGRADGRTDGRTDGRADGRADGRPVGLPVLSGSMLPDIPPGRTLLIIPVKPDACRVGDVAVFTDGPYRLVAHRLLLRVGLGRWTYWFQKGDHNPLGGWINARRICGLALGLAEDDGAATPSIPRDSVLYKPERVRQNLRVHLRNRLLAWPRKIRDRLTGAR